MGMWNKHPSVSCSCSPQQAPLTRKVGLWPLTRSKATAALGKGKMCVYIYIYIYTQPFYCFPRESRVIYKRRMTPARIPGRANLNRSGGGRTRTRTEHGERGVGGNGPRRVFGRAAVHAHVVRLDVHDEEDVVVGHDVHPALPGGGEIRAAVLLPGNLRRRVALGGALQPGRVARSDGAVPGRLHKRRQHCGTKRLPSKRTPAQSYSWEREGGNSVGCFGQKMLGRRPLRNRERAPITESNQFVASV